MSKRRALAQMEYLTGERDGQELTFGESMADLAESAGDALMTAWDVTVALFKATRQAVTPASSEAAAQEAYAQQFGEAE